MKFNISILSFAILFLSVSFVHAEHTNIIEMEVQGMTCPFCVYGLKKKLEKLSDIKQADVSLKDNKIRLTLEPGVISDEALYREAIKNSGFTSDGISHFVHEAHP